MAWLIFLYGKDVRQVDGAQLVLLRARDIPERLMNRIRRMHVEQTDRKDLYSSPIAVQHRLGGIAGGALDFVAGRGVDGVDGVSGDHAPQRREHRAAHQRFGLGDIVSIVECGFDAIRDGVPQVDEIAVTG